MSCKFCRILCLNVKFAEFYEWKRILWLVKNKCYINEKSQKIIKWKQTKLFMKIEKSGNKQKMENYRSMKNLIWIIFQIIQINLHLLTSCPLSTHSLPPKFIYPSSEAEFSCNTCTDHTRLSPQSVTGMGGSPMLTCQRISGSECVKLSYLILNW